MRYGDPISVIIPVYNRRNTIIRAVRSVLGQSYEALELIVVDDGSKDGSADLVEAIADPRLRVIRQKNSGAAAARHAGVMAASHELIAFQDSDDEWLVEKLARQMRRFCELPEDYAVVFCQKISYGSERDRPGRPKHSQLFPPVDEVLPTDGNFLTRQLQGNLVGPQTALLKRKAYMEVGGFDTHLRNNEDWDLFTRLAAISRIDYMPEPLLVIYRAEDGISLNIRSRATSFPRIFGKLRKLYPERTEYVHAAESASRSLFMLGKTHRSRIYIRKAIAMKPMPMYLLRYALTYTPGLYRFLIRMAAKR